MHRRYDAIHVPIELLRTLVAIEDLRSVSKAAEALNLTQPAISAQIRRLGKLVGGEVRYKGEAGSQLTPKGEMIVRYARRILALNDQILLHARSKSMPKTCHLGLSIVYAGNPLRDILLLLHKSESPDDLKFDVDFEVNGSIELAKQLSAGHLDIAIVPTDQRVDANPYAEWKEKMVWLCAKNFLHSPDKPIPLIGWRSGISHNKAIEVMDRSNVPYTITFVANDWSSRLAAVRAGLGYIATTERTVEPDLKIANEYYLPRLPDMPMSIYFSEAADIERIAPIAQLLAGYFGVQKNTQMRVVQGGQSQSVTPREADIYQI